MSCCTSALPQGAGLEPATQPAEILLASRIVEDGLRQTDLSVPGIHCGGCIQKIEKALGSLPDVEAARVNLSTKRVTIRWRDCAEPPPFIATLDSLGYPAHLHESADDDTDGRLGQLVR